MLDIALTFFSSLLVITGIIGCVLPVLPGPGMALAGMIMLQISSWHPFSQQLLVTYAIITVIVIVLDYIIPVYGAKRLHGSKYGVWGSAAGLMIGIVFLFPVGILIGPVLGAFFGEVLGGKRIIEAIGPAFGSFLGFFAATGVKLLLTSAMAYHFFSSVYIHFAG